jgi:hypothetical protein
LLLAVVAAYVALLAVAFRRSGWRGLAMTACAVALLILAAGTVSWARPHEHVVSFRPHDWPCHATSGLPSVALLFVAVGVALSGLRRSHPGLGAQLAVAWLVAAPLVGLAVLVELHWSIMVLNCDTL